MAEPDTFSTAEELGSLTCGPNCTETHVSVAQVPAVLQKILPPKINAILRLDTQTNAWCEITKISIVFYEMDLDNVLSLL